MKPVEGKTTGSFERLVDAASKISTAKDNLAEASNNFIVENTNKSRIPETLNLLTNADRSTIKFLFGRGGVFKKKIREVQKISLRALGPQGQ